MAANAQRLRPTADPSPPGAAVARIERFRDLAGTLLRREVTARDAAEQEAQVARARRVGADTGIENLRDLGPAIRRARGEVVRDEVKLGRNVTTRGARTRDYLLDMRISGRIAAEEFASVELFRDDISIAAGYSAARELDRVDVSRSAGTQFPAEAQLDALARVRATWRSFASELRPIVARVVVEGQSIRQFCRETRCGHERGAALLRRALDVLAERYFGRERLGS